MILKVLWSQWELLDENGFSNRMGADGHSTRYQLLMTAALIPDVLKSVLKVVSDGHLGGAKTSSRYGKRFYWSAYRIDVKEWIHQVFGEVVYLLGMRKILATPLDLRSVGTFKRFNCTIIKFLSKVVDNGQRNCDKFLPLFLLV